MLLGEAVVPAAIPGGEPISVPLPGARKRGAGQCLDVDVSVCIRICGEVRLCLGMELAAKSIVVTIGSILRILASLKW